MRTTTLDIVTTVPVDTPSIMAFATPSTLVKRAGNQDNTCGYFNGDADDPFELCPSAEDCNCQTSGGFMASCALFPTSSCNYHTTCLNSEAIYMSSVLGEFVGPQSVAFCDYSDASECRTLYWTDLRVSSFWCGNVAGVDYLSFSHPETTVAETSRAFSSSKTTSSRSTLSDTIAQSIPKPPASKTSGVTVAETNGPAESKGMNLSGGAIAGIATGGVAVLAILIGIIVWIMKHRKTVQENEKRTSSFHEGFKVNNVNSAGPQPKVEPPTPAQPVEKDAEPVAGIVHALGDPLKDRWPTNRPPSSVISPMSSPDTSPRPRMATHLSVPSMFTQKSNPVYNSLASGYQPSQASHSDPVLAGGVLLPPASMNPMNGQSWYRASMTSEMEGSAVPDRNKDPSKRLSALSELVGSPVPEARK